jgi:GntR family transcriptional regulator
MKDIQSHELSKGSARGDLPLYMQLHGLLMRRLEAGEWAKGAKFPTLEVLMQAYGVSRVTVREAIRRLERDGIVSRSRGHGTHVLRDPSKDRWLLLPGTWDDLVAHISSLAGASQELAREECTLEGADKAARYIRLRRLNFTANAAPYSITDVRLALDIYARDPSGFDSKPILQHLAQMDLSVPARAHQELTISTADQPAARLLGLDVGAPVACVLRQIYDRDQRLIYSADIIYPARHLRIQTQLV